MHRDSSRIRRGAGGRQEDVETVVQKRGETIAATAIA
jgi:hypothetical protein